MSAAEKYEREALIGCGTFGRCWLVRRRTTKRRYVLKELPVSAGQTRSAAVEVQALARCTAHVNVIRYREAFRGESSDSEPLLCIVMEYAEAGWYTVADWLFKTALAKQTGRSHQQWRNYEPGRLVHKYPSRAVSP